MNSGYWIILIIARIQNISEDTVLGEISVWYTLVNSKLAEKLVLDLTLQPHRMEYVLKLIKTQVGIYE